MHGGAGHPMDDQAGCVDVAFAVAEALVAGGSAVDAATDAVVALEDDERFNAGLGAELALDGETVELHAAFMESSGRLASVVGLRAVRHPILVARRLAETPMCMLHGEGATAFARAVGFPEFDCVTDGARQRYRDTLAELARGDMPRSWEDFDLSRHWNFAGTWEAVLRRYGHGTVGCVARDADGHLAVATSTGGATPMLRGRVGDTPIVGCGFYAGPHAAIAVSGIGEYAIRTTLARTVYERVAGGAALQDALDHGIGLVPADVHTGIIAVTPDDAAWASNIGFPLGMVVREAAGR